MHHMHAFLKRQPALKAALAFGCGIYLADKIFIPLQVMFISACLIGIIFFLLLRSNISSFTKSTGVLIFIFSAGIFRTQFHTRTHDRSIIKFADRKELTTIIGIVETDPVIRSEKTTGVIRTLFVLKDTLREQVSGMIQLNYYRNQFLPSDSLHRMIEGDTIQFTAKLRIPPDERNPGEFNYRVYLHAQDITAVATVIGGENLKRIPPAVSLSMFRSALRMIRMEIRARLDMFFAPEQSNFISGLLLGDRSLIHSDIITAFTRTGTIHILSVSGTHVGMLLIILFALMGRVPLRIRTVCIIAFLLLYMFITGNAPPVVRAVVMATALIIGAMVQRKPNPMNSLGFAALLLLVIEPGNLFLVGFQLSFAAVLSILLFFERLKILIRYVPASIVTVPLLRPLFDMFALTISVQIGTAPMMFYYFGSFSLISFAANMIIVPLIFIVLACSLAVIFFTFIWNVPATLFAATGSFILTVVMKLTEWMSSVPFASVEVSRPSLIQMCIYFVIVFYLMTATKRKILYRVSFIALSIAAIMILVRVSVILFPPTPILRITMFDVGQGDAIDIELPSKQHVLIDTGPRNDASDSGLRNILPFYKRSGIDHLAALFITHPDLDHIGGSLSIIHSMRVDRVFTSGYINHEAKRFDSIVVVNAIPMKHLLLGDTVVIDPEVRMYVLHPSTSFVTNNFSQPLEPNNSSIVLMLVFKNTKILLTGDVEREGETQMVKTFGSFLRADVLKVGHHGSTTSTTPEFALNVRPSFAIISCGKLNKFNHPRKEVLTRLNILKAEIHRTDEEGAMILESDGEKVIRINWR